MPRNGKQRLGPSLSSSPSPPPPVLAAPFNSRHVRAAHASHASPSLIITLLRVPHSLQSRSFFLFGLLLTGVLQTMVHAISVELQPEGDDGVL
jgi:hypothetical protein